MCIRVSSCVLLRADVHSSFDWAIECKQAVSPLALCLLRMCDEGFVHLQGVFKVQRAVNQAKLHVRRATERNVRGVGR